MLGPAETARGFQNTGDETECLEHPPIATLASTLASARLFIGNDSGVSHLAATVGAPTVAIYGPTSDVIWRPDGARVRTVRAASGALADVSASDVLAAVDDLNRLAANPHETSDR